MDDERDNCGDFLMLKNTTPKPCSEGRGKSRLEGVSLKADVTLPKLTRVPVPMKHYAATPLSSKEWRAWTGSKLGGSGAVRGSFRL